MPVVLVSDGGLSPIHARNRTSGPGATNLKAENNEISEWGSAAFFSGVAGLAQDCIFLAIVEIISLISYAPRIGFYTDDWAFLSYFNSCHSQSFYGLFGCLYSQAPNTRDRPLQIFLLTALYKTAGVHPIGSQVCIALLLIATVSMFYVVLRKLHAPRLIALSLPLIYGLLPQYSTDRFWMASSQSLVSMFFGFLCFYCVVRSASANPNSRWRWYMGAAIALLVSASAYEIFVPLFVLIPFVYWYSARYQPGEKVPGNRQFDKGTIVFLFVAGFLVIGVTVYKLVAVLGTFHFRFLHHIPQVIELGLVRAFNFNYGYYGLGLPAIAWNAVRFYANNEILILAGILACLIVTYFLRVARLSAQPFPEAGALVRLLGLGLVIYGLGYSPFFAGIHIDFTTMGPENRIGLAAAVGSAVTIVSLLGLASTMAPSNLMRTRTFTVLVTIFAVSGFVIVNALGCFWVAAYRRQNEVVASIRRKFPVFPQGSVLILDGLCPSIGPAPVFEFDYDLQGVLRIDYGNPGLRADVVSPVMKVGENGLTSVTYGYLDHYAYANNLILFNLKEGVIEHLTSAEVARQYFQLHDPDFNGDCRPARLAPSIYPFKKSGFVKGACSGHRGTS